MSLINKKSLEHLTLLARLELNPKEIDEFLVDLSTVLSHFQELGHLDISGTKPIAGGKGLVNIFREDSINSPGGASVIKESFPEEKDGFLKTPPIFE